MTQDIRLAIFNDALEQGHHDARHGANPHHREALHRAVGRPDRTTFDEVYDAGYARGIAAT